MTLNSITLRISTPTEPTPPGRGFYQLEEDALFVQIGAFSRDRKFFSYLESDHLRLDLDRQGRLIFIEVNLPRRRWTKNVDLTMPDNPQLADIRWLDFRQPIAEPVFLCNRNQTRLLIQFAAKPATRSFLVGDRVILEADADNHLASIWVDGIEDDLAGREISTFRKRLATLTKTG